MYVMGHVGHTAENEDGGDSEHVRRHKKRTPLARSLAIISRGGVLHEDLGTRRDPYRE